MRYLESLNKSLIKIFQENKNALLIGEDVLDPYGGAFKVSKGLSTQFPGRIIGSPISEAGIVGMGTGLALKGYKPIIEIMFGDFITLIVDQLVNSATKFSIMYNESVSVPLIIRTPMGGRRGYGPTHSQTLETLFLNIPNLKIIAPSICHNPGMILEFIFRNEINPVLFIENKLLYTEFLIEENDLFSINTISDRFGYKIANISISGENETDLTVITYGGMLPITLQAVKGLFIDEEIYVNIIVPSLIKPIDVKEIIDNNILTSKILIVEESIKYGGWGGEIAAQLHEFCKKKTIVNRLGAKEYVIPTAIPLEKKILPQEKDVYNALISLYEKNNY